MYAPNGDPPPLPPQPPAQPKPRRKHRNPQAVIHKFWSKYNTKTPGKITSIFPCDLYEELLPSSDACSPRARNASRSYDEARQTCLSMIHKAVENCERTNTKFCDPDFDIDGDFTMETDDCLVGLEGYPTYSDSEDEGVPIKRKSKRNLSQQHRDGYHDGNGRSGFEKDSSEDASLAKEELCIFSRRPGSVHRTSWIFENPRFVNNSYSSSAIKQGSSGNCWWLAAVAAISHRKDLMDKICVARDEECGVYGFVFFRDGEWIPTIVDDNLYLSYSDFGQPRNIHDSTGKKSRLYRSQKQTGSDALYFSRCINEDETWLPLLEKAYAKVHGDYGSLTGGSSGAGVEDMTGGVSTAIAGHGVLRKERLWRELVSSSDEKGEFVFSLGSYRARGQESYKNGLTLQHAYSVMQATEVEDENGKRVKLVKIRNPWGERNRNGHGEWQGPWGDGSREWTAYMIKKLKYEFGDDGIFWMSFDDMLDTFRWLYRTRLFGSQWTVVQQWTSIKVPWIAGYQKTTFIIDIQEQGLAVFVLSQLDKRYFVGLEGEYDFSINFLIREVGSDSPVCQVYSHHTWEGRSVNCEIDLKPGRYEVIPKVKATRLSYQRSVASAVRHFADENPSKLRQIALQYDLAHAKEGVFDEDEAFQQKRAKKCAKVRQEKEMEGRMMQMTNAMRNMQFAMSEIQESLNYRAKGGHNDAADSVEGGEKVADDDAASPPGRWPVDTPKDEEEPTFSKDEPLSEPKDKGEEKQVENDGGNSREHPTTDKGLKSTPKEAETDAQDAATQSRRGSSSQGVFTPATDESKSDEFSPPASDASDTDSSLSDGEFSSRGKKRRWNAVCVLGLRVYALHDGITVRLGEKDS